MSFEDDGGFHRRETAIDGGYEVVDECWLGCGVSCHEHVVELHGLRFCSHDCASRLYQPVCLLARRT